LHESHSFLCLVVDDESSDIASAKDNRELVDSRENQLLSKDEIHSLRVQGFTGEASHLCLLFMEMLHCVIINQCHCKSWHYSLNHCPVKKHFSKSVDRKTVESVFCQNSH